MKNIVITGAARGMGKAIAEKFALPGHRLILCSKTETTLAQTAEWLKQSKAEVHFFAADLTVLKEVKAFARFSLAWGAPFILINNAGTYVPGNCIDEPEGNLEFMLKTNLFSTYELTRALVAAMIENKQGHIFNISSIAGLQAYPGGGGYSISKFAMRGFTENLRQELMNKNIKVTGVYPGAVFTDSWAGFDNSENRIMLPADIADMIFAASQLSPAAVVEDIIIRPQQGDL